MRSLHNLIILGRDRKKGGLKPAKVPERLAALTRPLAPHRDWIETVLDRVAIKQAIPGRMRFFLDFTGDEVLADTLRRDLQKIPSVRLDSYSIRTRTALVTYDPVATDAIAVTTAVLRGVRAFAQVHGECDLDHHHHSMRSAARGNTHDEDCDHDHSATATDAGIRKELLKLTATGIALGYFVYRRVRPSARLGGFLTAPASPLTDLRAVLTVAAGYPIFKSGLNSVQRRGKATDDTLISIAVIATLLMGESLTGLSVVWLINLGKLLEAITLKRSRTAIKELLDITPLEAWLVDETKGQARPEKTAVADVKKGQVIRVFAGEKVPLDGTIVRGQALFKEAFLTGEAMPRSKGEDDEVYAGSLVEAGEVDVRVRNLVTETVVARMIDAIENIRENKAPIEKVGNRFAARFVPISIGISVATLVLTGDLRRAITMLVIACPCAAGLATPTAVSASIGQAARRGILIKGGTHVEAAAKVNVVVFDKTGTLTAGHPGVQDFIPTRAGEALGADECLRLAACAEQHSTHPLGVCLTREAKARKLALGAVEDFTTHAGMGITVAQSDGRRLAVGSERFMSSFAIAVTESLRQAQLSARYLGDSLVYLARDAELLGVFIVHDQIRPEAKETLAALRKLGVTRLLLATGDQEATARYVAGLLGIEHVHANLLPADKLRLIDGLKADGYRVAMVGDGVNDAQALTSADLSLAMGAGKCDVAIETADVTLARDDLMLVADTLDISQRTLRTIHQNFFFSVSINALGVGFGALGKLSPFAGAIVHNASTIAVVLNSLKLGREVARANPLSVLKEIKL